MNGFVQSLSILAVFPVLVGPLQTLLAVLPAILLGLGSMLFAAFKPAGFVRLVRFCWRQKFFFAAVAGVVWAWQSGVPARYLMGNVPHSSRPNFGETTNGDALRGSPDHAGRGPIDVDATASDVIWTNARDKTVLSSPAVSGDRVIFATATDIGPFSPLGRGAIVCVDAHSGKEIWRYAPDNYRATFSSPVVHENFVVCGEGLHQVEDARVTCLDLHSGQRRWEFRTKSHVESTAAIADGRVFIGAGDDGFYCLALAPTTDDQPQVVWHLDGTEFPDCESSPVVSEGVVYFGLGEGDSAVCAVDAATGRLLWRVETPYPVFAAPTVAGGKLFLATGNGNYVQSAADLLEMKLQTLRDDGASEAQLAAAREKYKPVGEVWCVDLATRHVDWKFITGDAILGAVTCGVDSVYFGSRDRHLFRVARSGELLHKFDLREPVVSTLAVEQKHVYCSTASGRLFCLDAITLKPVWDTSLGGGETFASSPTAAHGHVYIGTAEQGLRCVGRPGEPEPPMWMNGERGGPGDDVLVPDSLTTLWEYPSAKDEEFWLTAPLMPFDNALYACGEHDLPGVQGERFELVKLRVAASDEAPQLAWSRRFDHRLSLAPVGCGDRVCVAEFSKDSPYVTLFCLATDDGHTLWSRRLRDIPTGLAVDARHVFVWIESLFDPSLACLDIGDGSVVWDQPIVSHVAPAVVDGLLVAAAVTKTATILFAIDSLTGMRLWDVESVGYPVGRPVIDHLEVRLPLSEGIAIHSLIDGRFLRRHDESDDPTRHWSLPDEALMSSFPSVSLKGRVYFLNDNNEGVSNDPGRIVCLGAEQP